MTDTAESGALVRELRSHFGEAALRARLRAGTSPPTEVLGLIDRLEQMVRHSNSEISAWVDLVPILARVRQAIERNDPPELSIIGPFKAGKSSVLNALLGDDVAPVDVKPTTLKPTFYRQGAKKRVRFREHGVWRPESWDQFRALVHGGASELSPEEIEAVEAIEVSHPDVPDDLVLVDTPGFHSGNADDDRAALAQADATPAYVWVMDINKGQLADHEVAILRQLQQDGRPCFAVLNKADGKSPADRSRTLAAFKREHGDRFTGIFLFSATARQKRDQGASFREGHLEHLDLDWDKRVVPTVAASSGGLRARAAVRELRTALNEVLATTADEQAQADACVEAGASCWDELKADVQDVINRHGRRLCDLFEKESKALFQETSRTLRRGVYVAEANVFSADDHGVSQDAAAEAQAGIQKRCGRVMDRLVAVVGEAMADLRARYATKVDALLVDRPVFADLLAESDSFDLAEESMEEMFAYGPALALRVGAEAVVHTLWAYGETGVANAIVRNDESLTTQLVDDAVNDELLLARMKHLLYGEGADTSRLVESSDKVPCSPAERLLRLAVREPLRVTARLGDLLDIASTETDEFRAALEVTESVDLAIRGHRA